jgi:hypothetical protein
MSTGLERQIYAPFDKMNDSKGIADKVIDAQTLKVWRSVKVFGNN